MKPPGAKCTTSWKPGRVTAINSTTNIEVDGIPRHVQDIRHNVCNENEKDRVNSFDDLTDSSSSDSDSEISINSDTGAANRIVSSDGDVIRSDHSPETFDQVTSTNRPRRQRHPPDWFHNHLTSF